MRRCFPPSLLFLPFMQTALCDTKRYFTAHTLHAFHRKYTRSSSYMNCSWCHNNIANGMVCTHIHAHSTYARMYVGTSPSSFIITCFPGAADSLDFRLGHVEVSVHDSFARWVAH